MAEVVWHRWRGRGGVAEVVWLLRVATVARVWLCGHGGYMVIVVIWVWWLCLCSYGVYMVMWIWWLCGYGDYVVGWVRLGWYVGYAYVVMVMWLYGYMFT